MLQYNITTSTAATESLHTHNVLHNEYNIVNLLRDMWSRSKCVLCTSIDWLCCPGLDEEGLYRKPGVISKASKLVKECLEKGKIDQVNFSDEFEWDTKTLASSVKMYLNKHLGEPLFTFTLHQQFIDVASKSTINYMVYPL